MLIINIVSYPNDEFARRLFATLEAEFGNDFAEIQVSADSAPPHAHPPNLIFFVRIRSKNAPLLLKYPVTIQAGAGVFTHIDQVAALQADIAAGFDATFESLVPPEIAEMMK